MNKKYIFLLFLFFTGFTHLAAQENNIATGNFSVLNWIILAVFLIGTTVFGELVKGKDKGLDGFFKGGNNLPWWAVSLALIATTTSVSTFIAVPAFVFSPDGDLTYLQMTFGFALGSILMIFVLLKEYYQEGIYSPYDFIQNRLGVKTSQLSRTFFMGGATLSQAVRLLGTALVLSVITGQSTIVCIFIITVFAVVWSYIGGITTVVWTAAVQFAIFIFGALFALFFAIGDIPGGLSEMLTIADTKAKLVLIDLSLDPHKTYTLWVGILGCTFFQFGANAVDQVVTQCALSCKSLKEARKAVGFSALGLIITWVMAIVGIALVAFYDINPLSQNVASSIATEPDRIFPYYVVNQLPDGVSGVIIAAMFAAGISTLTSALAALSQTSVMGVGGFIFPKLKTMPEQKVVNISKYTIVVWGAILGLLAYMFSFSQGGGLLALGFKVPGYVYGTLVGIAFLALMRKGSFPAILIGSLLAVAAIAWMHNEGISFFWWFPVGAIVVMATAILHEFVFKKKEI
ncbi:sodium:solute symporter family transporter [Saccharicrinis sp. 156]|uniref:sodium:solute symporter family transporter n=1 Tax=Saccharicrinis sp. 156 TaxID=3417574 RepID=UPI003D32F5B0